MPFLPSRDPDVLETRSGGGLVSLFGLPFFLVGLFVMQIPLGLIPVQSDGRPATIIFSVLFGAVFALVGGLLIFGRGGMILDRRGNTLVKWWGLLAPMKRKVIQLDLFKKVALNQETRRSKNSSYTVYPVRLAGDLTAAVEIEEPRDYQAARGLAEQLAKFLNLPLADSSSGAEVMREAGKLDESLRDQVKRTGERVEVAPAPFEMKTRVTPEADGYLLEIPPPGPSLIQYFMLLPAVVFSLIVITVFLGPLLNQEMPLPIKAVFIGIIGVFFVALPIGLSLRGVFAATRAQVQVQVRPDLLRVVEKSGRREKVTEIPARELEELTLPDLVKAVTEKAQEERMKPFGNPSAPQVPSWVFKLIPQPGIIARSDTAEVRFGAGLPGPEMQYIYSLIKQVLTKR